MVLGQNKGLRTWLLAVLQKAERADLCFGPYCSRQILFPGQAAESRALLKLKNSLDGS